MDTGRFSRNPAFSRPHGRKNSAGAAPLKRRIAATWPLVLLASLTVMQGRADAAEGSPASDTWWSKIFTIDGYVAGISYFIDTIKIQQNSSLSSGTMYETGVLPFGKILLRPWFPDCCGGKWSVGLDFDVRPIYMSHQSPDEGRTIQDRNTSVNGMLAIAGPWIGYISQPKTDATFFRAGLMPIGAGVGYLSGNVVLDNETRYRFVHDPNSTLGGGILIDGRINRVYAGFQVYVGGLANRENRIAVSEGLFRVGYAFSGG